MSEMTIREQLLAELDGMTEEELAEMLAHARRLQEWAEQKRNYDPEKDPMLKGFFKGSPDLAERSSEILRKEFGIKPDDPT